MTFFKRLLATCMAVGMTASTYSMTVLAHDLDDNMVKINVISFNDLHGTVLETGPNDRNLGAAKLVTAAKEAREKNENTIIVSAGDNYNGTAISNLLYGEPVSTLLNRLDIVGSAVGNHEFDWGVEKIQPWAEAMNAPFITANIFEKSTNQPVKWAVPYIIEDVGGVNVGIIGLTTLETPYKTSPENVNHLDFRDPVEVATEFVPIVREAGADIIILLTHIGSYQDSETGDIRFEDGVLGLTEISGVDAIITAHSHQSVAGIVNGIPIVQGWYNGRAFAVLEFIFDMDTNTLVSSEGYLDELYLRKADISDDPEMALLMQSYLESVGPILDEVIGQAATDFVRDRGRVSAIGQWTAEVMQRAADAQVAVTNAGGLRVDLSAGDVTIGSMYEIMPFDNVLAKYEMTGMQLKDIFEVGIENESIGTVQFSGIIVEHIPNAERGSKVIKMTLSDGTVVMPDGLYTVVTNDFMGSGGDGYTSFLEATHLSDSLPIRDLMINAIRENGILEHTLTDTLIAISDIQTLEAVVDTTPAAEPAASQGNLSSTTYSDSYVVQKNDILSRIAIMFETSWQELADFNNLRNPHLIFPNQVILIP